MLVGTGDKLLRFRQFPDAAVGKWRAFRKGKLAEGSGHRQDPRLPRLSSSASRLVKPGEPALLRVSLAGAETLL